MLMIKILKINYQNTILAIVLSIMLILTVTGNYTYVYYNNLFKFQNENLLSDMSIDMIIVTVTGDKNFLNNELESIYKDLYIIHLLVLSGSNLFIFNTFMSLFVRRDKNSYFVILLLAILNYYCYIYYLHPVARALIFMTIADLITFKGLKSSPYFVIILKVVLCFMAFVYLQFSISFLLSFLFSLLITFYHSIFSFRSKVFNILSSFILFPVFISIFSIPIQLYFFSDYNLKISLFSNILIASVYDYIVFVCYLAYFIGFNEPLSMSVLPILDAILKLFFSYLSYIHYLIKLYN